MSSRLFGVIALFVALCGSADSRGAVIVSYAPNFGVTGSDYPSDFAESQQLADYFKATADGSVSLLIWWGVYRSNTPVVDDFTVRFYAGFTPSLVPDYSAAPANVVRTPTGITDASGDVVYEYTANLPNKYLVSNGESYYFSVVNNVSSSNAWAWLSSTANDPGNFYYREAEGASWTNYSGHLAFELDGKGAKKDGGKGGKQEPVPEPCAVCIWSFLAGVLGVGRHKQLLRSKA